jgi:hypothetical protein
MDPAQYYITTLTNAAQKLGPIILFIVIGYIVFIKLPFWFFVKVQKENRPKTDDKKLDPQLETKSSAEKLKHYQDLMEEKHKRREQQRQEEKIRQERKKDERERIKSASRPPQSASELFQLKEGEIITKKELKKRYHELLKQNHPDKFSSQSLDLKKVAEKKTKEINSAYQELIKKTS